jgi:hypothetical protein
VDAAAVASRVAAAAGDTVCAIVFFGSRKTRARPDVHSAFDFFVVVTGYRPFYDAFGRAGIYGRSPLVATALNRFLAPNVISVGATRADGSPARAKCAVLDLPTFLKETSERRRDHFVAGRLFQPVEVAYARSAEDATMAVDALAAARRVTVSWVRPWLPETFDASEYGRTLLQVSYSWEIRPEPTGRAEALWDAQRPDAVPVYELLLEELAEAGALRRVGEGRYALSTPVTAGERWRVKAFFRWSLVRATARWAKYVVTFDGWLEFLLRKAQRHSGQDIVLTERERRHPLVFLWPRVIRYLRHKDGVSR